MVSKVWGSHWDPNEHKNSNYDININYSKQNFILFDILKAILHHEDNLKAKIYKEWYAKFQYKIKFEFNEVY